VLLLVGHISGQMYPWLRMRSRFLISLCLSFWSGSELSGFRGVGFDLCGLLARDRLMI
jgi:hypothetical protein